MAISIMHSARWTAMTALLLLTVSALYRPAKAGGMFNVRNFGASGGDSTGAFIKAFAAACAGGGTVYVPPGDFTVQPFAVEQCSYVTFQVEGTVSAPASKGQWHSWKGLGKGKGWIQFDWCDHLTVVSNTRKGTFDGKASITNWWNGRGNPISLSFTHCEALVIRGITVRNSPGTHIQVDLQMIEGQQGLLAEYVTIDSHDDSPNTDGIHLSHLWNAIVRKSKIGCGDDCVVFQTDCKNILVEDIDCGPGNGVSLGSLGNGVDSCMNNILVQRVNFYNTLNGARVKAWPNKGAGGATGITFRDLTMVNVHNPIIVSQCYEGGTAKMCGGGGQSVGVYDVVFENIKGTCGRAGTCIVLTCVGGTPCVGITLKNVNLQGGGVACNNAYGSESNVFPRGCLQPGLPPAGARSSAAARVSRCSYGTNGYYSFSGPGAPGSTLRKGGRGGGGGGGDGSGGPRAKPPKGRVFGRRLARKGGMHKGRKGHHPRGRGMHKNGKGMHRH